ncbi:GDP-mannose 4,6-dehydratase [bacterium]|nr:GDP-mannose 4,6-dehydratase [candidate division CSSED10-310 bacterium]
MIPESTETILITGGTGFAGRHLIKALEKPGRVIHVIDRTRIAARGEYWADAGMQLHMMDLTHPEGLRELVGRIRPTRVFHLAGRANVKHSWHGESETYTANVIGAVNLLCALRDTDCEADTLIVSSGEVYGWVSEDDQPIDETRMPSPRSPYAASKYCQEIACLQIARSLKGKVVVVRPFNHIGPGQRLGFVTADFANQVARIENGRQLPVIRVGNLESRRDFTDVRDTVAGYIEALACGQPGDVINVCSGHAFRIQDFLDYFLEKSRCRITVEVDPNRFRPADVPLLTGNPARLERISGWAARRSITDTLDEILDYWRFHVDDTDTTDE